MNTAKKTVAQHREQVSNEHPIVTLVPDDKAQERHPKASSTVCGASRNLFGQPLVCGLPVHHAGDHEAGHRVWRRSSGDE